MEKCAREKVLKSKEKGGYSFPNVQFFLDLHFWVNMKRIVQNEGIASKLAQYLGGRLFIKWNWMNKDLKRPVAFYLPRAYTKLQEIREEYKLGELGEEDGDKNKIKKWKERNILPNEILGFGWKEAEDTWRKFRFTGLLNKQKDLIWAAMMNILPTRTYLKARDQSASEKCPRKFCAMNESVHHIFWACDFARSTRFGMRSFLEVICKIKKISYSMILIGWCRGEKSVVRRLWLVVSIYKQVLWEARCLYFHKKVELSEKECMKLMLSKLYDIYLYDANNMGEDKAKELWNPQMWYLVLDTG